MIRGDVCYYTFKAPDKRRPVLVLTRDRALSFLNEITVAPITTTIRKNDSSVWLDESDGMRKRKGTISSQYQDRAAFIWRFECVVTYVATDHKSFQTSS